MENPGNTETATDVANKQASDAEVTSNLSIVKEEPVFDSYFLLTVKGDKLDYKYSPNLTFLQAYSYLTIVLNDLVQKNESAKSEKSS